MALSKADTNRLATLDRAIRNAVADRDLCRAYRNQAGAARCTQVVDELLDRRHRQTRRESPTAAVNAASTAGIGAATTAAHHDSGPR